MISRIVRQESVEAGFTQHLAMGDPQLSWMVYFMEKMDEWMMKMGTMTEGKHPTVGI